MRRMPACALFLILACAAAQARPPQEWLAFQAESQVFAAGPTGMYAAQDMQEINPGETLHLPSAKSSDAARWARGGAADGLVVVEYRNGRLLVSGPGFQPADLMQAKDRQLPLPGGLIVKASPLRGQTLKLWLYNPALPALRQFKGLAYFAYDVRGEVQGIFRRNEEPIPVNYLDSRDQQGVMYDVGSIAVQIEGRPYTLKAFSYKKSWDEISELLVLLKDRTSGKTTYGGGRVVDVSLPKAAKDPGSAPVQALTLNLNMAYSFLCAHSSFYNCPLVLTSYVDADLNFGEKHPPSLP